MKVSAGKNGYIELLRFIAAMGILLFHTDIIQAGWVFVEFFYMLIGLFAMKHMLSAKEKGIVHGNMYPFQYTWKRFKKIFPYTTISIVMLWILKAYLWRLSKRGLLRWALSLPANLLQLWGFGVMREDYEIQPGLQDTNALINPHLWFVACMIVALLFYIFFIQHSKKTKVVIFGVLPFLLYGFLIAMDKTITGWHDPKLGWLECDMRALAGILLGGAAWYLACYIRKFRYSNAKRVILTIVESATFIAVLFFACVFRDQMDIVNILLLFITVTLSASCVTYSSRIKGRFFIFLGALSLPIYCLQLGIIMICYEFFPKLNNWAVTGLVVVFGIICYLIVNAVQKIINKNKKSDGKLMA